MEDVLAVYHLPYDALVPVVCMDESCKQLIGDVQAPVPGAPGQVARVDHEYVRNGVAEIFLEVEPLTGRRHVAVTEHRGSKDWAWWINLGLGETATQTRYRYDTERRTTTVERPDRRTVDFQYDTAGRLTTVTHAYDQVMYAYDGANCGCRGTGMPAAISNSQTTLAFTYDGTLPLSSTWSGMVSGSVSQAYNNDFRVVSQKVNGGNEAAFHRGTLRLQRLTTTTPLATSPPWSCPTGRVSTT